MSVSIGGPRAINENGGTLWKGQDKSKYQQCECCPYGYHIDLDFVRYCEAVSLRNEASVSKERRKERRRQRQSMEVLLGLTSPSIWNLEQQLPQIAQETSVTPGEDDSSVSNKSLAVGDALHKAVQDFEDTLERTHVKPPGYLILEPPDVFLDGRGSDRLRGSADDASLSSMSSPVTPQEMVPMSSSAAHEAMLQDFDVASIGSAASGLSHGALQNIRHQMAVSLERMRELEEQVKLIPILQVQLSVAKEEKRKIGLLVTSREAETHGRGKKEEVVEPSSPSVAHGHHMDDRPNEHFEYATPADYLHPNAIETKLLVKSPKTTRKNQNSTNNGFIMSQCYMNSTGKLAMRDVGLTCSVIKRDIATIHKPIVRHAGTSTDDMKNHINSRDASGLLAVDSDVNCFKKDTTSSQLQGNSSLNESRESHVTLPKDVQSSYSVSLSTMDQKAPNRVTQMSKVATRDVKIGTNHPIEQLYTKEDVEKMVAISVQEYKEMLESKIKHVQREEMAVQVDLSPKIETKHKPLKITEHRDFSCQISASLWARDAFVQATIEAKHYSEQGIQAKPRTNTVLVDATRKTREYGTQKAFVCAKCDVEKRSFGAGCTDIRDYTSEKITPPATLKTTTKSIGCNTVSLIADKPPPAIVTPAKKPKSTDASTATVNKKLIDIGVGTVVKIEPPKESACKECERKDKLLNNSTNKNEDMDKSITDQESRIPRRTPASVESRPFKRQTTYTKISPPKVIDLQEITKTNNSMQDRLKTLPSPPHSRLSEPAECPAEKLLHQSVALYDKEQENAAVKTSPYKFTPLNENPTSYQKTANNLFRPNVLATQPIEPIETELPEPSPSSSTTKNIAEASKKQETIVDNATERFVPADETSELADILDISTENRTKAIPSKKMQAALKVVNDSLKKSSSVGKAANDIIQREWFQISSMPNANPHTVEDYLDVIEETSSALLEHVVNITDKAGNTAMHYALSQGNFDIVSILLDSKVCNINRPNAAGYTAVMLVSLAQVRSQTHRRVLQRFLANADVNIRAKQHGQTALMLAVSHNRLDMVQLLMEGGADLNIQDEDGSTALMCAAEHGHAAIVQFLISQPDADQGIKDVDGSTALDIALDAGHKDVGILLYAHKHFSRNNSPHSSLRARRSKSGTPTVRSASTPPASPSPLRDKPAAE